MRVGERSTRTVCVTFIARGLLEFFPRVVSAFLACTVSASTPNGSGRSAASVSTTSPGTYGATTRMRSMCRAEGDREVAGDGQDRAGAVAAVECDEDLRRGVNGSPRCASFSGSASTGRCECRMTESATEPSQSGVKPPAPCVVITIRSALMRSAMSVTKPRRCAVLAHGPLHAEAPLGGVVRVLSSSAYLRAPAAGGRRRRRACPARRSRPRRWRRRRRSGTWARTRWTAPPARRAMSQAIGSARSARAEPSRGTRRVRSMGGSALRLMGVGRDHPCRSYHWVRVRASAFPSTDVR
jgi:hypothetical protein